MKIKQEHILIFALLLIGSISRLVPHAPNFTAVTAMALFAGAYLKPQYALWLPALVLFVTDLFLGFHSTMVFVYGAMMIVGLFSYWGLSQKVEGVKVLGSSLVGSLIFFVITNLGVFLVDGMYSKNLTGFVECYVMALPFLKNQLAGDLFFSGLFFGAYKLYLSRRFIFRTN